MASVFMLCGQPRAAVRHTLLDRIIAVVNDEVIVNTMLQAELATIEADLRRRKTRLPPRPVLEKQMLDRMIIERIQLQLAKRTGIRVDDNALNPALRELAADNGLSLEDFRSALEDEGYQYVRFRENIREQMIIQRLRQRHVVNRINVTQREIDNFLANQVKQGKVSKRYHLYHILIAVPEAPSPETIQEKREKAYEVLKKLREGANFQETAISYSDSSQALQGGDLGWRKAGAIPSLFMDAVPNLKVDEVSEPIRNASGFHIIKLAGQQGEEQQSVITQTLARHILIKTSEFVSDADARIRLQQLKERIEGGADFGELASAHSDDSATSAEGGDLGWIDPGTMVPEFEETMNSLKPGEISTAFESRYGWHLVQAVKRRNFNNTEQLKRVQAAKQIRMRKIEDELQTWLRQLRDEAYVEDRLNEE
ncbi:MAG: molecular chaperone SurA [Gammaproteobacteria bacterium]|nr:molecular chaperone SurA [Gammaproteobacteria bacterium]